MSRDVISDEVWAVIGPLFPAVKATGRPPVDRRTGGINPGLNQTFSRPVAWTEKLALDGIAPSIGSVGDAYDNALMETINGLYTAECIRTTIFHDGPFKTIADVEYATAGWVDWHNHRRLHGSLGMSSPVEYEAAYYESLTREILPA
ncbi:hypothetical protein GCM10022383_08560 [Microbacterium soli]|uniref:Integrase catalytic domain-containing protein n=1 Tax=Microbacterium soli TaxID=446075 RepID=A0ABP7MZD6_9MICO